MAHGRWTENGTKREAIKLLMIEEPNLTPLQVSKRLNTSRWYVYSVMRKEDLASSPLNRRICRMEARIKELELMMLKVLEAKGIAHRKAEFGL